MMGAAAVLPCLCPPLLCTGPQPSITAAWVPVAEHPVENQLLQEPAKRRRLGWGQGLARRRIVDDDSRSPQKVHRVGGQMLALCEMRQSE